MAQKWLVLLPILFLAALAAPALCKRIGWTAGYVFAGTAVLVTGFIVADWTTVLERGPALAAASWIPSLGVEFSVRLDGLGLFFAFLIASIGSVVFAYSAGYLAGSARCGRYFLSLGLFFAAMLGIALADNLLLFFVFWELTSFTSFLLIGFDHEDERARASALQALLITSAGGLALLGGVLLLGQAGGSYSITALLSQGDTIRQHGAYTAATLLILAGALTKSAQFPFHFWLPNAMAAPTPVSAYLHSAAMVKAGIFLLLRLAPILGGTALWETVLTAVGSATALIGALLALGQTDAKRMVAYATVSALGLLVVVAASAADPRYAYAAVLFFGAHALYKGALFMVVGNLNHLTGTRDIARWSGLTPTSPALAVIGVAVALSMAALPPAFAFIAKEELLAAYLEPPGGALVVPLVLFAGASFTAVAIAVGVRPFIGRPADSAAPAHRLTPSLVLGPALLAAGGLAATLFAGALSPWFASAINLRTGAAPATLKLWHGVNAPLGLSALSVAAGAVLFSAMPAIRRLFGAARPLGGFGPAAAYDFGVRGLLTTAKQLTWGLQNGRLSVYLHVFFAVLVVACLIPVLNALPHVPSPDQWASPRFYEVLLGLFITLAAFSVPASPSPFAAIAALGMVGYGVAIAFVLFGAPDLAMTQFLIETLMIVLFVLVFFRTKDEKAPRRPGRLIGMVSAVGVGLLMSGLALLTQGYEHERPVADFFLERSFSEGHGRNVVNVILVDFRAVDTFGEITVLALAALGVRALVKSRTKAGDTP